MTVIQFELPFTLPSLNALFRGGGRNGKVRGAKKKRADLAWAIAIALGRQRPATPLRRVRIRVERHAFRMLDRLDNLPGSLKPLIDLLQPDCRYPAGLGVILDDSPRCVIAAEVIQVQLSGRAEPKTVVFIEEA